QQAVQVLAGDVALELGHIAVGEEGRHYVPVEKPIHVATTDPLALKLKLIERGLLGCGLQMILAQLVEGALIVDGGEATDRRQGKDEDEDASQLQPARQRRLKPA